MLLLKLLDIVTALGEHKSCLSFPLIKSLSMEMLYSSHITTVLGLLVKNKKEFDHRKLQASVISIMIRLYKTKLSTYHALWE